MPKVKNIIIFAGIAVILILIYVVFIKGAPEESNLVISSGETSSNTSISDKGSSISEDFLSVLLNVKNIKLEDTIFSDRSFINLKDSSILLTPSGDEGRLNPFAPIGFDASAASTTAPTNP